MQNDDSAARLAVAWLSMIFGQITLSRVALALTVVYTALQIYVLIRDKILQRKRDGRRTA